MASGESLFALWALLAFGATLAVYATIRFLRIGRISRKPQKTQSDLLVETLKDQAEQVRLAVEDRDSSHVALQELDETYRAVTRNLPIGLMVFQFDGPISLVNPALANMIGGQDALPDRLDQLPWELVEHVLSFKEHPEWVEKRIQMELDHQPVILDLSVIDLGSSWFLLTVQDRTRVIQLQKRLKMSHELATMGEMASGMTHEVKNALSVISGHLQLISRKERVRSDERLRENVTHIETEIQRLLNVTRQFMQSSQMPKLAMIPVRASKIASELVTHWNHEIQNGRLRIDAAPDTPIALDLEQIKVAINNLVINALEAIESSGRVRLNFENREPDWFIIKVEDSGPGVSEEMAKNLFTPLVTSKETGSGLGLFQARKIAQAHQGDLKFKNQPTTFSIWLPLRPSEADQFIVDNTIQ